MNTALKTTLMGLGGLALAILLSLGAFALAGRSLGEPPVAVPAISRSPSATAQPSHPASPKPSPSRTGSASPTAPASASPSDDDHSGSGSGSDDPPGDDHGEDDD